MTAVALARGGDVNIAYRVIGDGPIDLVFVQWNSTHLDVYWDQPAFRHEHQTGRASVQQDDAEDRAAIERCVRDYFEAWYAGDAPRMRRALHPELAKRGLIDAGDGPSLARETSDSMVDFTELGVGTKVPVDRQGLEVRVDDVHGNIATATVISPVYREYVQLVRTASGWQILNTLWQPTGA
jgi:hypothetical protein